MLFYAFSHGVAPELPAKGPGLIRMQGATCPLLGGGRGRRTPGVCERVREREGRGERRRRKRRRRRGAAGRGGGCTRASLRFPADCQAARRSPACLCPREPEPGPPLPSPLRSIPPAASLPPAGPPTWPGRSARPSERELFSTFSQKLGAECHCHRSLRKVTSSAHPFPLRSE